MAEESPKQHKEVAWPEEARVFLNNLYAKKNAASIEEKIAVLESVLGQGNFDSTKISYVPDQPEGKEFVGKEVTVPLEVRLGFLEQMILENEKLVDEPTYY